jgi:integrase
VVAKNMKKELNEVGIYYYDTNDTLGKPDKIYYITYKKDGRKKWSKIGRKSEGFTKSKVRNERSFIVTGKKLPPLEEKRQKQKLKSQNQKWTLLKLWKYYVTNNDSHKGLSKEKGRFENHIQPEFGQREPSKIKSIEVDSFKRKLKSKGLSPQTVKNILEMLKRLSNYGTKKDLCKGLSFQIDFPKVNNIKNESLTKRQIQRLLGVLGDHTSMESVIMKVILLTGRRTSEICGLEWKNISLTEQTMILMDTKPGLNEKLPFSNEVKRIFEHITPKHKKYVFPNSKGEKKTRCDRVARNIMLESGLPRDYRPTYCLRHTFTSFSSNQVEVPYFIIQRLIGHKIRERDITSRYLHITDKVLLKHLNDVSREILKIHPEIYSKSVYRDFPR